MNDDGPHRLLGRQHEQQVLANLLTRAREGRSGVVVLRGEAGIGKTSLLKYALARASGFRTIRVAGFESEMEVSNAGLQQLCGPFIGRLDSLPAPQQRALRVALGLEDGDHPDRLMLGQAVLTLLSEASNERPTMVVVDDAQWVDAASLQALAFVARRILADPIVLIFAACKRRDDRLIADLPELEVCPLTDHDARTLLTKTVPGQLDEQVRENIIAEAGGNPLALRELHRVLTPADLAGGFGLAQATQLTNRLERAFGQRLTELPPKTKALLLVAAADPTGDPKWLAASARRLGISVDALEGAQAEDFVSVGHRVRFRHPLIRSAVYRGASLSERRRAHQALADVVDGPAAEEHQAWHLAHAASAPDEALAERLERAAQQACARSGAAAAAAFLARAVELTPDPARRTQRTLLAAEAKLNSGAPEAASKMLMDVQYPSYDPLLSARIDLLRARTACPSGRGGDMTSMLLATAKRLHDVDPQLARDTYFEALVAAILAGRVARPDATALAVASAARCAPTAANPRVVDLMLDGLVARILDGHVAGAPLLKRALREFTRGDAANAVEPRWYDMATRICLDLFDHDTFEKIAVRQLELFREAGVLAQLPVGLGACAAVDVFGGRLADAAAHLAEAEATATAIGSPRWRRIEPHLAAYRGDEKLCREMVHQTIEGGAVEHGQGFSIAAGLFALAVLHNGLGQYAEALAACERGLEHDDPAITGYTLAETVEAAARCNKAAIAAEALATLVERAEAAETDTALGLAARSRALVTDGPVAESEYRRAITYLEKSPAAVYLARSHLVYGEWLRRQGRRMDARAELRDAFDMFTAMGAETFVQRAGRELEATGETVRKRTVDAATELTTQESVITKLARDGHTNSEIAAQLFISARTVEWHLSKIFAKLGVSSRKELRTKELPIS